jgi:hypothetical protein
MQQSSRATLKATGEPVVIIGQAAGSGSQQRYLVQLPPQQPWHKPRHQEIRGDKLRFSNR